MAFQSSVLPTIGFGVAGERAYDSPYRVEPALLDSADATQNIFGRGFGIKAGATASFGASPSVAADPKTMTVEVGGTGVFAGLLVEPKAHVLAGTAGDTLAASLVLPNGVVVQMATEGDWVVPFATASTPGQSVWMATTANATYADGELFTTAPGATTPANAVGPIGTVARFVNTAAGLGVVHLEPIVKPGT